MSYIENKKEEKSIKNKLKFSGVLLVISILLFILSKYVYGFSNIYYKYIYLTLVNTLSRILSLIQFSVYEIMLYIFIVYLFIKIIIYFKVAKKFSIKEIIIKLTANILVYISVFIFLNIITLGVNSFKMDFVTLTGLTIKDSSEGELIELCENIKNKLNELDTKIKRDENGMLKINKTVKEDGIISMENLSSNYQFLKGFYPNPKPIIFSKFMSYQLLEGETTFTLEANYNNDMPKYNIPSTICHELSHIKGFNNEAEANYISFLACINSKSYEYQYSGYLMAYSYCMNDLYSFDLQAFKNINSELSSNVKSELKNDALYWNRYRGEVSKLYDRVYDKILKAGGQEEGIKSYNAVVGLLVSGYKIQFE